MYTIKEISFKEFMKVVNDGDTYHHYIRITELPDDKIALLTHREKHIKEVDDKFIWSEFCIIPGKVNILYKKDMSIPSPYVFHLHDFKAQNLITMLMLFNPEKERLFFEYYPKSNSTNNDKTGLNSDILHIRKLSQYGIKKNVKELLIEIHNNWISESTMLVYMFPNEYNQEIKDYYLKSPVFYQTIQNKNTIDQCSIKQES